ncbi:hypothetical protein, partial [Rosenbergiella nectarea]|uniref:hypothetical protein n=1 Tax=Rosenbergiella nectarea TaxID=988801 RepID=UPI001F4D4284
MLVDNPLDVFRPVADRDRRPSLLVRTMISRFRCAVLTLLLGAASIPAVAAQSSPRERVSLDAGWQFALGHASDTTRDFD